MTALEIYRPMFLLLSCFCFCIIFRQLLSGRLFVFLSRLFSLRQFMNSGKLVQNACKLNQNANGTDMNCSVVGCSLVKTVWF
jgi:hypothetical protein